jgi:hypothetical protein
MLIKACEVEFSRDEEQDRTHGFEASVSACFGAIADYTAVITLPDAPAEQVAAALVNRGFTKGARGDPDGAIDDYTTVIALPDAPADVLELARKNLVDR